MKPLFIIGYMASGKTTFGRALARRLGRQFIDLDFYIEQRFRSTIKDIFRDRGEDAFRIMEREMLREAGEFENVVIACGGGTPCFFDNMYYMKERGHTLLLETSAERIALRLAANSSRRPLMSGKNPEEIRVAVEDGLRARAAWYGLAELRFRGEELENRREIDRSVERFLLEFPFIR